MLLLLPAQKTHTLHDPIRDTEHARRRLGLGVGGLDDGGDVNINLLAPGISQRPAERPDELARGSHKWKS